MRPMSGFFAFIFETAFWYCSRSSLLLPPGAAAPSSQIGLRFALLSCTSRCLSPTLSDVALSVSPVQYSNGGHHCSRPRPFSVSCLSWCYLMPCCMSLACLQRRQQSLLHHLCIPSRPSLCSGWALTLCGCQRLTCTSPDCLWYSWMHKLQAHVTYDRRIQYEAELL